MLRTVIIDDEAHVRETLGRLLVDFSLNIFRMGTNHSFKFIFNMILAGIFMITLSNCKKKSEENQTTLTDVDGNVYNTVKIGTQVWMVGNLKVTHYADGGPIPNITNDSLWCKLTTGAYCNYANDEHNVIPLKQDSVHFPEGGVISTSTPSQLLDLNAWDMERFCYPPLKVYTFQLTFS